MGEVLVVDSCFCRLHLSGGWDAEEFLGHCCLKAGLPPDAWMEKFQAIVFEETKPNGEVRLKEF